VNVCVTLAFYRHGNQSEQVSIAIKTNPKGPKETNRKMMITILEKFMECCTY
jgi:hypothetical protein